MNAFLHLELKLLLRESANRWTLASLAIFALIAIAIGHLQLRAQLREQHQVISAAQAESAAKRDKIASAGGVDAGDFSYYQFYPVPEPLSPWRALSQNISESSIKRIRMLGLQGQLYDGSVRNPEPPALGRFDYAFVVVALLPLSLLVMLFNLRAADEQRQRLSALQVYARRWRTIYRTRGLLRLTFALLALLIPLWSYGIWQALDAAQLIYLSASIAAYAAAWLITIALVLAVIHRFEQRAEASAIAARLLTLWLLLVFVAPQWIGAITARQLSGAGPDIALMHRKSVADAWDVPKPVRFERFFQDYPQWQSTPPVNVRFHWKWYYAFHHVADMDTRSQVAQLQSGMLSAQRARDQWRFAVFPIAMQSVFDHLSGQRVEQRVAHHACIARWHQRLREHFYPMVFEEKSLTPDGFDRIPRFDQSLCMGETH
jgi:ABC-2 type transport system permease protein